MKTGITIKTIEIIRWYSSICWRKEIFTPLQRSFTNCLRWSLFLIYSNCMQQKRARIHYNPFTNGYYHSHSQVKIIMNNKYFVWHLSRCESIQWLICLQRTSDWRRIIIFFFLSIELLIVIIIIVIFYFQWNEMRHLYRCGEQLERIECADAHTHIGQLHRRQLRISIRVGAHANRMNNYVWTGFNINLEWTLQVYLAVAMGGRRCWILLHYNYRR